MSASHLTKSSPVKTIETYLGYNIVIETHETLGGQLKGLGAKLTYIQHPKNLRDLKWSDVVGAELSPSLEPYNALYGDTCMKTRSSTLNLNARSLRLV